MNEIDLIKKYLEAGGNLGQGNRVTNISYYQEGALAIADAYVLNLGVITGNAIGQSFFFGNVNINITISGVVVLTNQMLLNLQFMTILKNMSETGYGATTMGVNCGMSLLGNGEYEGNRRLYGMGFNRVVINKNGFGAATFAVRMAFNGYLFSLEFPV
jgi:hypothetical protein